MYIRLLRKKPIDVDFKARSAFYDVERAYIAGFPLMYLYVSGVFQQL